jgi:hypothetical protein
VSALTVEPSRAFLRAVTQRYAAVAALAMVIATIHLPHRPPTLCLVRAVTGIPCPLCGGTTAAVDLGHGNLPAAFGASPFALGLLSVGPLLSTGSAPGWWRSPSARRLVIAALVIGSEVWQLARFRIIS